MAVLVLIGWYAGGFLAAAHLVRHGHDRTVWTIAAALTGGMVAVAALVVTAQRALRPVPSLVTTRSTDIAVVVDRDPELTLGSLERLAPTGPVTLVALVSHEAGARWVDTGEPAEAQRRLTAHRTRAPLPTRETVLTGSPAALAEIRARVLVLPRDRHDRSRRHDAWRVLTAARASGAAVLSPAMLRPTTTAYGAAPAHDEKASA